MFGRRRPSPVRRALNEVDKLAQRGDVRGVVKALRHETEGVRLHAASALGGMHDERAIEPLKALAYHPPDKGGYPFRTAMGSLGRIGGPAAAGVLLELLANPPSRPAHPKWHVSAVIALGELRDVRTIEPLKSWVYQTGDGTEHDLAIRCIARIGGPAAADALLGIFASPPGADSATDPAESARSIAARALAKMREERAVEPLRSWVYQTKDGTERKVAIRCIAWIGVPAAADALLGIFASPPGADSAADGAESVRVSVARALSGIGEVRAIEPLKAWVYEANSGERRDEAIQSIVRIGGPAAGDALLELFARPAGDGPVTETAESVRVSAARVLGEIGEERAVEPLKAWMYQTSDGNERRVAIRAIARIGGPAAGDLLLQMLSDPTFRDDVRATLADVGDSHALPQVIEFLREPSVRSLQNSSVGLSTVVEAVGKLGYRQAVPLLCELLLERLDAEGGTRDASSIAVALGRLRDRRAVPALCKTLERASGDTAAVYYGAGSDELFLNTVRVLEMIGDPRARGTLLRVRHGMRVPTEKELAAPVGDLLGQIDQTRHDHMLAAKGKYDAIGQAIEALR